MPIPAEQVAAAEAQIAEQTRRIEFFITEYSVELLAQKMQTGDFEIPSYQRDDTWEPERKSRFIESLLMGLPIPFLFFWERTEGKLEIVDGSQRLRTIQQFILGDFVLGELEVLTALGGMRFRDLPISRQRKINNRSIRGIVLNENADDQARFEIFDRINTGSKIANKAEVRRGALTGSFLDLVIDLTSNQVFKKLAPVSDKAVKLREREELVTRFFAYGDGLVQTNGLDGYQDRPSDFLFAYAKKMNLYFEQNPDEIPGYRRRFLDTMDFVARVFPYGFRRKPKGNATPRTRFEAIAIGSYLAIRQKHEIMKKQFGPLLWLTDNEFAKVIGSDGANAVGRLKSRIYFVRDQLLGA
jgi:hypothetical protein